MDASEGKSYPMKHAPQPVLPNLPDTPVWDSEHAPGGSIDLIPLVRSYVGRWPLVLAATLGTGVLLYLFSFLSKPMYESSAVFLPPPAHAPVSDNPLAALWMQSNTGSLYPGLLTSNSVVDIVLHALDLPREYKSRDIEEARKTLRGRSHVTSDTAGFYTIAVDDPSAARAKAIADQYLLALTQINARLAIDEANQQRMVYEHELSDAKDQLETAENNLARLQLSSGVVSAQTQTQAGLAAINELRAQITARQVQLAALRQAETDQAPAVVQLRSQVAALEDQLQSMEKGSGGGAGAGLSAARAPGVNLEFLRLQREVQYHQSLYEVLLKQFESTQLQANSAQSVQIVDYPELPLRKSKPRRRYWALFGAVGGLLVAVIAIFVEDRYRVLQQDPERREELASLSQVARRPGWKL